MSQSKHDNSLLGLSGTYPELHDLVDQFLEQNDLPNSTNRIYGDFGVSVVRDNEYHFVLHKGPHVWSPNDHSVFGGAKSSEGNSRTYRIKGLINQPVELEVAVTATQRYIATVEESGIPGFQLHVNPKKVGELIMTYERKDSEPYWFLTNQKE